MPAVSLLFRGHFINIAGVWQTKLAASSMEPAPVLGDLHAVLSANHEALASRSGLPPAIRVEWAAFLNHFNYVPTTICASPG
jgi:hypothetical protein